MSGEQVESKELTAEEILAANDIEITRVEVPEWGGHVYVKAMSGTAKEKYIESIRKVEGFGKKQSIKIIIAESSAKLAQQTICDKTGKLLFSIAQVGKLGEKSSKALDRCVDAAAKLNGLHEEAEEEAKNDSPVRTESESASSSASPAS